jgi:small subunit ribosomal protein S14
MAKKSWFARDKKKREMVARYAERRKALKAAGDYEGLQKLPRNASPVRVNNRCPLSGRSRGFIRRFGVARVIFRDMALDGRIPGVRKSSW